MYVYYYITIPSLCEPQKEVFFMADFATEFITKLNGKLTPEQVIHNIGVRSGIGRPLVPHLIRHTTATNAIDHGMDVTDLQKLLGHTRISTTMIYAKVTQENVRYSHHRYVV